VRATIASAAKKMAPETKPARGLQLQLVAHRFSVVFCAVVLGPVVCRFFLLYADPLQG